MNDGVDPVTGIRMFDAAAQSTLREVVATPSGQDARRGAQLAAVLELRDAAHRQTVPLVFCSVFVQGLPGPRPVHGRRRRAAEPHADDALLGPGQRRQLAGRDQRLCFEDRACTLRRAAARGGGRLGGPRGAAAQGARRAQVGQRRRRPSTRSSCASSTTTAAWVRGQEQLPRRALRPVDARDLHARCRSARPAPRSPTAASPAQPLADGVTSPFPGHRHATARPP